MKKVYLKKITVTKHHIILGFKSFFWFGIGAILGLFFTISFAFIVFQHMYGDKIYPGIYVNNIDFGGKTEQQAIQYFNAQNKTVEKSIFIFKYNEDVATVSAKDLKAGYN